MAESGLKEELCRTAKQLVEEGYIKSDGCVSIRKENRLYITPQGGDLSRITPGDLAEIDIPGGSAINGIKASASLPRHLVLYRNREEINAIIHVTSSSIICSSQAGELVKPLLDDMAQIVGISIRTAPDTMDMGSLRTLVKAFRGRNCVLIRGEGALCGSGSMDDAYAVCQVSEKACKSWIESAFLGGGHAINALESMLMRFVYLKKYSRQDLKNTRK